MRFKRVVVVVARPSASRADVAIAARLHAERPRGLRRDHAISGRVAGFDTEAASEGLVLVRRHRQAVVMKRARAVIAADQIAAFIAHGA